MPRYNRSISRRALLRSAVIGSSGLLAAYVVGCGDGDGGQQPSPTATATPSSTPTVSPAALGWRRLSPAGPPPPARRDHSLVTNGQSLFLFAGRGEEVLADLWSYDLLNGSWTQLTAGPPARFGHNAIFDTAGGRLLIFGGQSSDAFFNDVWAYDVASGQWTDISPAGTAPSTRYGAASAFDPAAGRFFVTHGFTGEGSRFDDTWAFTSAAWTKLDIQGALPIRRCLMRAAWDPGVGRLFMFGGQTTGTPFLGDFWALEGNGWRELPGELKPSPRNFYAMAFDDEGGRLILFGGDSEPGSVNDLWFFDSASETWSQQSPEGEAPSPRFGHDAAWLPTSHSLVIFGGNDDSQDLDDLWELSVPV